MFKFFALLLCVTLASGLSIHDYYAQMSEPQVAKPQVVKTTPTELTQLLTGFNDALGIQDDQDFDNCAQVPLAADLAKTFHDLSQGPNPLALVADVMANYKDFQLLKSNCPQTLRTYEQFFMPVLKNFRNAPVKALEKIVANVISNLSKLKEDVTSVHTDFKTADYYSAGQAVGSILNTAFNGLFA